MKALINQESSLPITSTLRGDGNNWTVKQRLLLGLSGSQYLQQLRRNPVNWLLLALLAVGLPLL
ncbi:MAG: polysulfide reductase, partial [Desulforhopalus sp.]|nr:polysulfide reductase [Desulforhopalus sp.]